MTEATTTLTRAETQANANTLLLLNVSKVGRLTQTTESCVSMCVMAHVYWIWEKGRLLLNLLQQKNLLLL